MRTVLLILAGVVVLATLLPLLRTSAWWIRVCDFPRVQIATLGAFVLVGLFFQWPTLGPGGHAATVLLVLSIVFAVETDAWWERALHGLEENYPYQVKHPRDNTYGLLLYARFKLTDTRVRFLVKVG